MSEALFKVGSVYRDGSDRLIELTETAHGSALPRRASHGEAFACVLSFTGERRFNDGGRRLSDGRYLYCQGKEHDYLALIPGELTFLNGEWVATPTLDKMEAEKEEAQPFYCCKSCGTTEYRDECYAGWCKANAEMILRDGPAKPKTTPRNLVEAVLQDLATPLSTAKPANEALTRLAAQGHRLGMGVR